ncbi:iron ABC transporter permease [Ruminococcaceae bacterium OttesenSCG-928-A16]|nr:iron ABC transporter permease [Ruminococcaceae bacterium OttesenSCG-928-A16]
MKKNVKIILLAAAALFSLLLGIGVGSVFVPPGHIVAIFANKLFGIPLPSGLNPVTQGLLLNIRLPRVLLAFLVGAALAVSGTVMQSVLKNPLASPFGLGVSSGAGFGAALVIVGGLSSGVLGSFLLPVTGLSFGLATVLVAVAFASRIDKTLSNNTIILTGMVLSLFINALMSTLAASSPGNAQRITLWQLGSFAMKEWSYVWVLLPVVLLCTLLFTRYARELDLMTFGEEQAMAAGLNLKQTKWVMLVLVSVLTGTAVSFVGIVGFVDLIAPHVVRRFFGSSHRVVVPASALFGGTFMVLCDLAARTLISPSEIPIGSITAIIGAPFFIYVFLAGRKKG